MNERSKNILISIIILGIYIMLYFIPTPINPIKAFLKRDTDAGCAMVCLLAVFTMIMQSQMSNWRIVKILNITVASIVTL